MPFPSLFFSPSPVHSIKAPAQHVRLLPLSPCHSKIRIFLLPPATRTLWKTSSMTSRFFPDARSAFFHFSPPFLQGFLGTGLFLKVKTRFPFRHERKLSGLHSFRLSSSSNHRGPSSAGVPGDISLAFSFRKVDSFDSPGLYLPIGYMTLSRFFGTNC